MATCRIVAGPSKWDLIIEALGRCQEVEFTFEGLGKVRVKIQYVGLESGCGESWLIAGLIPFEMPLRGFRTFKGYYSTKHRAGTCEISPP